MASSASVLFKLPGKDSLHTLSIYTFLGLLLLKKRHIKMSDAVHGFLDIYKALTYNNIPAALYLPTTSVKRSKQKWRDYIGPYNLGRPRSSVHHSYLHSIGWNSVIAIAIFSPPNETGKCFREEKISKGAACQPLPPSTLNCYCLSDKPSKVGFLKSTIAKGTAQCFRDYLAGLRSWVEFPACSQR